MVVGSGGAGRAEADSQSPTVILWTVSRGIRIMGDSRATTTLMDHRAMLDWLERTNAFADSSL